MRVGKKSGIKHWGEVLVYVFLWASGNVAQNVGKGMLVAEIFEPVFPGIYYGGPFRVQ